MKRTTYQNGILVFQEDLNDTENYRVQAIKERLNSTAIGYNAGLSSNLSYFGIVKEPVDAKFQGTENTEYSSTYFTLQEGVVYTRFNIDTDLSLFPMYNGGERVYVDTARNVNIKHRSGGDVDNYVFLVYVELKKNKKFDDTGITAYFIDREESYVIVQLTQAEVNTLGNYSTTPNNTVSVSGIEAPYLDSVLTNDEKTTTFGAWSSPGGVFTIGSVPVTHYNSVYLGKVFVTDTGVPKYKFYHTLPVSDPLYGTRLEVLTRPLFSVVDAAHRNQVGNGTVSATNPHGTSVTDLGTYEETIRDHRNTNHDFGIIGKYTASFECVINGTTTPDTIVVTNPSGNDALFLQGKRITLFSNNVSFNGASTGVYYIYMQSTGSAIISATPPYDTWAGIVNKGTTVPADGFVLCSVYYDSGTQTLKAYNGDTRYNASSVANPVTDLRLFGNSGYESIHNSIFESLGKESLLPNGNCEIAENDTIKGWSTGTAGTLLPANGSRCLLVANGLSDTGLLFPFDPTRDYSFRARVHTKGISCQYQINLIFYRGGNRSRDRIGTMSLKAETATYTTWGSIKSDYNQSSTITWETALTDRNAIGFATLEIISISGNIYFDEMVIKNKTQNIDFGDNLTVLTNTTYTVSLSDNYTMIMANATSGAKTITLPVAGISKGFRVGIKKSDTTGNTVTLSGANMDGQASLVLSKAYDYVVLEWDGSNYQRIGGLTRQPYVGDLTNIQHDHSNTVNGGSLPAVGGLLGTWTTKTISVTYHAETDGFFFGYRKDAEGLTIDHLILLTDSANPPTTIRSRISGGTTGENYYRGVSTPVRKGDYYLASLINGSQDLNLFWIPLGV